MKKCLILTMIGLMLGIQSASSINDINNPENLVFGKIWIEGSHSTELVQRLHVEVTNNGPRKYKSWWIAIDPDYWNRDLSSLGMRPYTGVTDDITLEAGETKEITIDILFFEEGHHDVYVWQYIGGIELFSCSVDIDKYRAPRLRGEIKLDMLEQTDDGNILYGDFAHFRITGTVTITNEENFGLFGDGYIVDGGTSLITCSVNPWFAKEPIVDGYEPLYSLADEIGPGETITKEFSYNFTAKPEEDMEYGIDLDVLDKVIARIPFKVRQCTNTYWTADGHVKPLPVNTGQVLKVPAEALAVDMRGQYETNTTFSIDVSEANPNCLYYLGFLDNVPQGFLLTTNVIRDYEASLLCVDTNYDYFCPMPFRAKTAMCQYTPVSEAQKPTKLYVGTLVLPFNATQGWLVSTNGSPNTDAGFNGDNLQVFRFIGEYRRRFMHFARVTDDHLNAYEPYLIYTIPSQVVFSAEDIMVPSTRPAVTTGTNYDFIGHTTQMSTLQDQDDYQGVYTLNNDYYSFRRINTDELLPPFTANFYVETPETPEYGISGPSTNDLLWIGGDPNSTVDNPDAPDAPDAPTKIDGISDSYASHSTAVYSLSGQRVGTAEVHEGRLTVSGLRPGLYIIDGKKIVVR